MSIFQTLTHISPLALLGSGALIGYARNAYAPIKTWIDRRLWVTVSAVEPDGAYVELDEWIDSKPGSSKVRNMYFKTSIMGTNNNRTLVPGFGDSYFFWNRTLVKVNRVKSDQAGVSQRQLQTLTLRFLFGNRKMIEQVFEEGRQIVASKCKDKSNLYAWELECSKYWSRLKANFRSMDSVTLPKNQAQGLIETIRNFTDSEEKYASLGVPYRHGILLSGLPGTGKTSVISSLASELETSVYLINLAATSSDESLQLAVSKVPKGAFIVFEDVDTVTPAREQIGSPKSGASLGGLLNIMDGFLSGYGVVYFMTTNKPERLDPALIRSGRIDTHIEFGYAEESQIRAMFRRFFPDSSKSKEEDFVYEHKNTKVTTSDLQEKLFAKLHGREVKSELYEVA